MAHKHRTPGPWKGRINEHGQLEVVAGDQAVCIVVGDNRDNARLITAAPELYEALIAALKGFVLAEEMPADHWARLAQAAIHKVRCG